jgi:hypothetical protein
VPSKFQLGELRSPQQTLFLYIFRSSANNRNFESFVLTDRLLIEILNKRRTRIEVCGTLNNTEKGEENFPKIRLMEDLFNK